MSSRKRKRFDVAGVKQALNTGAENEIELDLCEVQGHL